MSQHIPAPMNTPTNFWANMQYLPHMPEKSLSQTLCWEGACEAALKAKWHNFFQATTSTRDDFSILDWVHRALLSSTPFVLIKKKCYCGQSVEAFMNAIQTKIFLPFKILDWTCAVTISAINEKQEALQWNVLILLVFKISKLFLNWLFAHRLLMFLNFLLHNHHH